MLVRLNPHVNGLRRYPRLREQQENEEFAKTLSPCYFWYSNSYKISLLYVLYNYIRDQHHYSKTPKKTKHNLYRSSHEYFSRIKLYVRWYPQ